MKRANRPSRLVLRFFRFYCNPQVVEDIEGDLLERFENRSSEKGLKKARQLFKRDVLLLFRPGIIRPIMKTQKLNSIGMFKNNIKVAKRQLLRNKTYSTIKIGGLAIGMAACILIGLFIKDELSYDKHIPDNENLFRLVKNYSEKGDIAKYTWFQSPFAKTIMDDFPEVTLAGRTMESENLGAGFGNIRKEDEQQNYYEDGFIFADQSLLDLFNFPMIYGDAKEVLTQPFSLVLTQEKADKIFPGENPIGKTVILNNNTSIPYTITGVLEDLPENGFFKFNYVRSLSGWEFWSGEQTNWQAQNYQVFAHIEPGADLKHIEKRLEEINTKYMLPAMLSNGVVNAEDFLNGLSYSIQPVTDIHLRSANVTDVYQKSDIKYIWIFGLIAVLILALACINFINLSTAKSANRAKEVGLRKTLGSFRSQLINQFLTESILYSLLSFLLAVGLVVLLLPYFNNLSGKNIIVPFASLWFVPTLVVSALTIGCLAGVYPAFYLSKFKPVSVLRGKLSLGGKSSQLRNTLVVFQFTASTALIIGTFVVYQQLDFILNTKTGFDKEQVVVLRGTGAIRQQQEIFKDKLSKIPNVSSSTISGYLPITGTQRDGDMWWKDGRTQIDPFISAQIWNIDYGYLKTLGMKLAEGRNFDQDKKTDNNAVIINQAMAKSLGINKDFGSTKITSDPKNGFTYNVIGIVEDFNYDLLTEEIQPLILRLGNSPFMTSIKVEATNMNQTLAEIEKVWEALAPGQPFVYQFMDQSFKNMYLGVQKIRDVLSALAILAVIIACLGLFGLSVFMVEQRSKEISVRLVLGAKISQVVGMLSINFIKPIILALLIATPVAWYVMREWLKDFEYKISMDIQLFVIAGILALMIALITVSFQSIKAAFKSPIHGLRNE